MIRTGEQRRARIARDEPGIAADLAEVVIDHPDQVFQEAATIEVGGRPVDLRFLGRGHTDHDVVISIPGADVVFAGDLVEGGAVPFFNDAYPLDWPATANLLADLVTGTIVPGRPRTDPIPRLPARQHPGSAQACPGPAPRRADLTR